MILLRSMYLFGTLRSTLALIIFGSGSSAGVSASLGLGWTTKGEHHVMGSVFGLGLFRRCPLLLLVLATVEESLQVVRDWSEFLCYWYCLRFHMECTI